MPKLNRRSAAPVDDDALLKRRRTIETAALVARSFGMVSTALAAAGTHMASAAVVTGDVRAACWAGVAAMAVTNTLSYLGRRRPASAWYPRLSAMQSVLDTATIVGIVVLVSRQSDMATWPLLAPAIAVAATRHQLRGALLVFAATTLGFALLVPGSPELFFLAVVGFMIAVITGTQASALNRHLTALNETRRELQHQATHDPLTGLPNRGRLAAYADERAGRPLAVLLLDLNGFKQINDTYGHAAGDLLLHEVGTRLTAALGPGGMAGRLGGDEFLVLLPEADPAVVARALVRIRESVRQPIAIGDGRTATVGVSAGVALRPSGGDATLDALCAEADAAMYRDKRGRAVAA
ncbi:sensor domain-containing diguanylate cyclase [Actinoplanes italicus]|uniref:Diguanylate cyclase (GGDEF)-like protein n=1 Tax=Actinoplanes italicus TaxID=113567 RepID=A0A2T0K7S4_9ACTN|nr:sensor domain-containing diguanylate cyclase [Actinoplanes italicus]PRX19059.1 diguanylate cyclase (GGDEF)-like protein [Actinoplanes italicus]